MANRWPLLDSFMVFCATYLIYVMVLVVLVYVAVGYKKWRDMALVTFVSAFFARFVIGSGIRYFYHHARPDGAILIQLHLLITKELASSFPSGHSIFAFAMATAVYLYNKKAGLWFYLAAFLVGIARIFVGVHWPLDILGGIILGIPSAIACNWLFKKYKHKIGL